MANVFISHRGADTDLALEVHGWLKERHDCFIDRDRKDGIKGGKYWESVIFEELRRADAVVCVVTPSYITSDWCIAEIGAARVRGSQLLPLRMVEGDRSGLLDSVQEIDAVEDRDAARDELLERLRFIDGFGGHGWSDEDPPYPGLRPFLRDDRSIFFGRRDDVQEILKQLRSIERQKKHQILAVVGQSGCGKSSIVRAGVLPQVAEGPEWLCLPEPILPGSDPVERLAREFTIALTQAGAVTDFDQVHAELVAEAGLVHVVNKLLALGRNNKLPRRFLIVIDQFEELLTAPAQQRNTFAKILAAARDSSIDVLVTLRTEFLGPVTNDPYLKSLGLSDYLLRPLGRDGLRTVIEEPARLAGITVPRELLNTLVEDTIHGDALPLLALTLEKLADGVPRGGQLSRDRYKAMNGIAGALIHQAGEALADAINKSGLTEKQVVAVLLDFVDIGEGRQPIKRRVSKSQLTDPQHSEAVDSFVKQHLIVTDGVKDERGNYLDESTTWTVCHDAFFEVWPRFSREITERRSALRKRRELQDEADEWYEEGRRWKGLWDGDRLATARDALGVRWRFRRLRCRRTHSTSLDADGSWQSRLLEVTTDVRIEKRGQEFLSSSLVKSLVKSRTAWLAVILVIALLAGLAVWALKSAGIADDRARQNTSLRLVAEAQSVLANQAFGSEVDGIKKLIVASKLDWASADGALLDASVALRNLDHIFGIGHRASHMAFSGDGRRIAAVSEQKAEISLWNIDSGTPAGQSIDTHSASVYAMSIATDGERVAYADETGAVIIWSVSENKPVQVIPSNEQTVNLLAFNANGDQIAVGREQPPTLTMYDAANGRLRGAVISAQESTFTTVAFSPTTGEIATGSGDGEVRFWDGSSHSEIAHTPTPTRQGSVTSLAFSPDGKRIASAGSDGTLLLWDALMHRTISDFAMTGHRDRVSKVVFNEDGTQIASAGQDGTVRRWDGLSGRSLGPAIGERTGDIAASVTFAAGSEANNGQIISAYLDGTVRSWDLDPNASRAETRTVPPGDTVMSTAISSDGTQAAYGESDGDIWLRDDDGHGIRGALPRAHVAAVTSLAFSRNGLLVSGGADGVVQVWDIEHYRSDGPPMIEPKKANTEVTSVAVSDDGRYVAAGDNGGELYLWDRISNDVTEPSTKPATDIVDSLAFNEQGSYLALGGEHGYVQLFEIPGLTKHGEPLDKPADAPVLSVDFSPDDRHVAAGLSSPSGIGDDVPTLAMWSLDRDSPTDPISGLGTVNTVAFSRDGRYLASGGGERKTQIFDITGQPVGQPLTGSTPVGDVEFRGNDDSIVLIAQDGTVTSHPGPSNWRQALCNKLVDKITREEWDSWASQEAFEEPCA